MLYGAALLLECLRVVVPGVVSVVSVTVDVGSVGVTVAGKQSYKLLCINHYIFFTSQLFLYISLI